MSDAPSAEALVEDLLTRLVAAFGLEATILVEDAGEEVRGTLSGEDLGLFIGRHGQTIDAVQHLAQRIIHGRTGELRRVVIDAEGYRARRQATLVDAADVAADEAVRTERPVALDAMTASERRLVHEHLRDRGDVDTHSEGQEPARHLVVSPVSST